MGKQTRKELEDLEYYVELAKSRLKDANPALLTFGQVLTALLQDRLATLPEEAKPQPEHCGGTLGNPWYWFPAYGWHVCGLHTKEATSCAPCPGCADCAKPWHLQAAEAIWEAEERSQEAGYLRRKAPSVKEIAALILKYAPEARRQGEQPTSHHEPG